METGLWLLVVGLPLFYGAIFTAPKPPSHSDTQRALFFLVGGALSFFGWTMTILSVSRRLDFHPVLAVFLWLGGFGLAALALHFTDEFRKKRLAR